MIGEFDDPFQTVLGYDHGDARSHEAIPAASTSAAAGSSALVGLSRTRTDGPAVSADPMATRCCSPRTKCPASVGAAWSARAGPTSPRPDGASSGSEPERFHGVRQLVLDGVGGEPCARALTHGSDTAGLPGRAAGASGVHPRDGDPSAQRSSGEVRDRR